MNFLYIILYIENIKLMLSLLIIMITMTNCLLASIMQWIMHNVYFILQYFYVTYFEIKLHSLWKLYNLKNHNIFHICIVHLSLQYVYTHTFKLFYNSLFAKCSYICYDNIQYTSFCYYRIIEKINMNK